MNQTKHPLTFITTVIALMVLALPAMAKNVTATAQLDRSTVAVGNAAVLNITIKGDNNARVTLPEIDGLFMQSRGRSSNFSIINGRMSSSLTLRYIVLPDKEGDYTIAPITVESEGSKITIPQKPTLKVTKGTPRVARNQNVAPSGSGNSNAPTPQASINPKDIAHLEIVGLKDHAVVGELIPVEIRAYFKHNSQVSLADIQSAPSLDGSSFTVKTDTENPRQGTTTLHGENYYVVIFKAAISPIKPGEFKLPFSMDATVQIRAKQKKRARSRRSHGFFDDPFFDDVFDQFFTQTVRKEIHLTSKPITIKVTPAPSANKPKTFNGAVGKFTISATAPSTPIHAGDPITLTVRVSGEGNLSRLKMPPMVDGSGWKTYPAKHHLENADSLRASGTVVFEQTIVPRNPSVTEIPAIELAYFNPETETYQTERTVPIPIKVLPGTNIVERKASDASENGTPQPDPKAQQNQQLTPYTHLGWLRKKRLLDSTAFLVTTGSVSFAFLAFAAGLAWTRKQNTPARKAAALQERNLQSELKLMNDAAEQQNTSAFFKHAKRATQLHWAKKCNISPDAITPSDISDQDAREIIEMADSLAFSPESPNSIDLTHWKRKIEKMLLTLILAIGFFTFGAPNLSAQEATNAPSPSSEVQSSDAQNAINQQFKIASQSGTSILLAQNIITEAKEANQPGVLEWGESTLKLRAAEWALIGSATVLVVWSGLLALGVWKRWKVKTHIISTLIAIPLIALGVLAYQKTIPPAHDAVILYPSTSPKGQPLSTTNILVSPFDTAETISNLPLGAHVTLDHSAPETNGYLKIIDPSTQTSGWIKKELVREVGE